MKTTHLPAIILVLLCIGFLVYVQYSTSQLPQRVATHFAADGKPNGWMSRTSHLRFMAAFGAGLPLFIAGLGLVIKYIPMRLINMPNREYWLSPQRKQQSCVYIARQMIWMGCLTVVFFAGIQYTIVKANLTSPAKMPNGIFWFLFVGFMVAVALWTIAFFRRFSKNKMAEIQ